VRKAIIAPALVVVAVLAFMVVRAPSEQDRVLQGCELALQKRLEVPSSYRLLAHSDLVRRPATLPEYMGWWSPEHRRRAAERARRSSAYMEVRGLMRELFEQYGADYREMRLDYEAATGLGERYRATAVCAGTTLPDKDFEAFANGGPAIDGLIHAEWAEEPETP
jgi:hypothetical protein